MNPSALGTLYCLLSAVCYTMMNICQRELSKNCDPVWVNSVQAMVSTTVFGIYLTFRSIRGRSAWPPWPVAGGLILLGIVTQLGGSSYQWSLGVIGLAVGNPLNMGTMLAVSALLGLLLLGEKIPWQGATAIVLITVSVFLLSRGAEDADTNTRASDIAASESSIEVGTGPHAHVDGREAASSSRALRVAFGVVAACVAGVAFAVLIVGVRKTARDNTAPGAIVFFINAMGVAFLGPWAMMRLGIEGIMAVSARDYAVMLAIGTFNLFGFLLVTKGLQRTTVVRVNIITNALTSALSVVAGIAIFLEPTNRELVIGLALILAGMLLIGINEPSDGRAPSE